MPYNVYKAQQSGKPTKNDVIKKDIDFAISVSGNMSYFQRVMRTLGYEFRRGYQYEYIVHPMAPQGVRLINLGEEYTFEMIHSRIRSKRQFYRLQLDPQNDVAKFFETPPWEYQNIRELYVNFVTILGLVKERPRNNVELFRTLWEEEMIFDKRVEEQNLLLDHDLKTDEDVLKFKAECKRELTEYDNARRSLRNALRRAERAGHTDEADTLRRDIASLTEAMTRCRKHIMI